MLPLADPSYANERSEPVQVDDRPRSGRKVQLQELSPKHRQVAALLAQGIDRETIGQVCDFTPEYVSWLSGDPLFRTYMREMLQVAEAQLEALFEKSVDVIAATMISGKPEDQLKAARLQLEATRRIGPDRVPGGTEGAGVDRLERLAERLTGLLRSRSAGPQTIEGTAVAVQEEGQ